MRLAVIHLGQETNDFNPMPTTLRDFQAFGMYEGPEVIERSRGIGQVGGYLDVVERSGLQIQTIPIIRAWAGAGGRVATEARQHFLASIRRGLKAAGRVDGVAMQLHGAAAAEGVDDMEGEQLALVRELLGPEVPIVTSLDHHANITRAMIDLSSAVVGHRTQPHDPYDTGRIGAELLIRIARREVKPTMAWRKIPIVTHQEQFLTAKGPMKVWFDRARAMESDRRVLQASNYPMQPWLDVAEGGWATIVVTDNDRALAERLADELAELAWSMREDFMKIDAVEIDEAVRRADSAPRGVVVLSDTGDTVFGGSSGDSNLILESMLRLGIKSRALMALIEPATVARLIDAGLGQRITLPVGGSVATRFFTPLEVTGVVRKITGGGTIRTADHHQREIDMGRVVIFEVGPATLMVSELRGLAGNVPEVYRAFGIEPAEYKIAVLKTASNFQFFAPITSEVIRVDTRGPGQSDVLTLPWRRLPRPIFPLDERADWR